jgi:hypothetical protein
MGFKDKLQKYYADSYLKKYGDRMAQAYGTVLSIKVEEKKILFGLINKLVATVIIKPEGQKNVLRAVYKASKWFKKPEFMTIGQGNIVLLQGLKGEKGKTGSDLFDIKNIRNITTKKDLFKTDTPLPKRQIQMKRK